MNTDLDVGNLSDLSDNEIVKLMRKFNFEKYKNLVKTHLSFELDLNTDVFDLPSHEIVYEDKGKLKKWNRFSKKHRSNTTSCTTTTKSAGNSPTEGLHQQIDGGFMFHLQELKEFLLLEKNLKQEGIFRKTGSVSRQNELRLLIQSDKLLDLSGYSAHDCATVFKSYLAELPEPLLSDAHYPAHLQIAPLCIGMTFTTGNSSFTKPLNPERLKREEHLLNSIQLLLLLLPEENRVLLEHVIDILHAVSNLERDNKMSADNLATLFAPHLICPRNIPPEALHYVAKKMSSIISYMIRKGDEIFFVPGKLSTDIRAYLLDRKRKKTMSPEQTLDDSISDMSTVNTVYTFVDRERTAAAHNTNTTDTELAQLYAHIQSLPESSKKRRLIKQFNKQNGQGTPLQLVIMNRLKNSDATRSAKSFGDSIKKHIFHKGLMTKTPKRSGPRCAYPVGLETPNSTTTKHPKLRVLFQSPTPSSCSNSIPVTPELAPKTLNTVNATITANTPNLKTHPLQKSISSSSLLLNSSLRSAHNQYHLNTNICNQESESSSSDEYFLQTHLNKTGCSASAPVSRQTSRDLPNRNNMPTKSLSSSSSLSSSTTSLNQLQMDSNCCVRPLKLISDAAKHLMSGSVGGGGEKKLHHDVSDEHLLLEDDENSTILQSSCSDESCENLNIEFKSRYKSEPNLSRILKEKQPKIPETVPERQDIVDGKVANAAATAGKSLKLKLIKGVSMNNLKFPFSTPETTKRIVRSVSSTLKRRYSDDVVSTQGSSTKVPINSSKFDGNKKISLFENVEHYHHQLDDLDDETFEDDPNDNLDSESETDETLESTIDTNIDINNASYDISHNNSGQYDRILVQPSGLYRNIDLITSTPSLLLGRRSMSPITKSAQRMPKCMQESIMTPRSRKPVMVLTTTLGSSDQNQTVYQTELSSFREQDEEIVPNLHGDNANSIGSYTEVIQRRNWQSELLLQDHQNSNEKDGVNIKHPKSLINELVETGALSDNFKEYLLTRSVLTASPPIDSSFSSQPDDFKNDDASDYHDITPEIVNLNESQLSPSLLYCLDGNEPSDKVCDVDIESKSSEEIFIASHTNIDGCRDARKRSASNDIEKQSLSPIKPLKHHNKKVNDQGVEKYISTKKILISDFPNETSF